MKKLLFLLIASVLTISAMSQTRLISNNDTNTNAATSYINYNSIQSKLKAIQFTVTKISGTVAGSVYLQGTVDGTGWVTIDSLTLSDQAQNTKVFPITATTYNSYRAKYVTPVSQVSYLTMAILRRTDE